MVQRFQTPTAHTAHAHDPMLAHAAAIAKAAAQLKPLSHSTAQLIAMNTSPNVSTADLVAVITHDQVLSATVLREANSAASAAANGISTVEAAFVRLGMARILSVAVRLSMAGEMAASVPQYGLSDGELGLLSVTGSVAAEVVRERATTKLPAELSTAALLRDIGVLVLAKFLDPAHQMLLDVARESGAPLSDSERMVLDANHGEAGGLLCQQWKLPDAVRLGVQYHHDPFGCDEPIAHGVYLADTIAHHIAVRSERSWSHSVPLTETVRASADAVGLDPDLLDSMVDDTIERFGARNTGLSL